MPQTAWAQTDAGFLDNPGSVANPAAWNGSGWYCIDYTYEWSEQYQMFLPVNYILAGKFATEPDCDGY
jgi:hypothetical protein